ncbi:histidinol-phosphatase HisJ family protein [Natranaerofaba carboxydovora]|uniref:histidinol-phosphatase HisJ family protein n=1 Tax=Natranaerofaba carboxydovora TaxID=2742683 RepID=UPI001F13BCBD|nr:histidinol-phosphatase HisJ family protein [Natranaerofaba carboxydovora]UMZ73234.1 Histidinol-phosphatase [Natranaerofaba carboxydovora]
MLFDYHIHTSRCGHANGKMEDYVKKAIDKELVEIGFSDHFPMDVLGFSDDTICSMKYEELEEYFADINELRDKYKDKIKIRTGIEMDYQEDIEDMLRKYTNDNRWDYIIGSIHFIDGYDFSKPGQEEFFADRSIDDLYIKYFEKVKNLASSGLFDIIAHIDLIKKFGCHPEKLSLDEIYREIAKVLSGADLAVEINTAGWRHPVKEQYPSLTFIKELVKRNVPLTFGSDAHSPDDVAYNFSNVFKELKRLGLETNIIYGFSKRKPFCVEDLGGIR